MRGPYDDETPVEIETWRTDTPDWALQCGVVDVQYLDSLWISVPELARQSIPERFVVTSHENFNGVTTIEVGHSNLCQYSCIYIGHDWRRKSGAGVSTRDLLKMELAEIEFEWKMERGE